MSVPYRNADVLSLPTWVRVLRLSFLLPVAASIFAWIAAQHINDAYLSILQFDTFHNWGVPAPLMYYVTVMRRIDSTLHDAFMFEWVAVIVVALTALLLVVVALGCWRGFLAQRHTQSQIQGHLA